LSHFFAGNRVGEEEGVLHFFFQRRLEFAVMAGENFHDWLKKSEGEDEVVHVDRAPVYRSKHSHDVELLDSSFTPLEAKRKKLSGQSAGGKTRAKVKPALPKDVGIIAKPNQKNFVIANAVQTILDGFERKPAKNEMDFLKKPDYGKVPEYLQQIKTGLAEKKRRELEEHERAKEQEAKRADGYSWEMSEEERLELLGQLKREWDNTNHKYQAQTHVVTLDTVGKIKRKENLEKQLKRIEDAIDIIKNPVAIFYA